MQETCTDSETENGRTAVNRVSGEARAVARGILERLKNDSLVNLAILAKKGKIFCAATHL